jgi:hypothetical protein
VMETPVVIRQMFREESMSKNGDTSEEQSQEHVIAFFDIKGC